MNTSIPFSQGPLKIVRMFGSILTPEGPGFGCLSVTFACADCSVVGGVIAGPLIAATAVQVSSDAQISKLKCSNLYRVLSFQEPCESIWLFISQVA
jgi:hypothetical protein